MRKATLIPNLRFMDLCILAVEEIALNIEEYMEIYKTILVFQGAISLALALKPSHQWAIPAFHRASCFQIMRYVERAMNSTDKSPLPYFFYSETCFSIIYMWQYCMAQHYSK